MFLRFPPRRNFILQTAASWTLLAFFLTSCAALDSFFAVPATPPPTETAQPTPTIVWFPPSATPSPQPFFTRAPTPDMRPSLGEVFLSDSFSRPSLWDAAPGANVAGGRLNLAAQKKAYLASLRREPILSDFYAEISAFASLCRGDDTYGVLIRASGVSAYRFTLSCGGWVGAERAKGKSRFILQEPIPSADVPVGAGEVRLGVWARGKEMRLFLNGRYQFSVFNENYPAGNFGVFVNAAGETPVVVSFFNLVVREIK